MAGSGACKLAINAKLYRNTGTYGSPTWTEIGNVGDLMLNLDMDEAEAFRRAGGGFKEFEPSLLEAGIEWNMIWDLTDTNFTALWTAFFARTAVEFLCMDASQAVSGNKGLRATMKLFKAPRKEDLGGVLGTSLIAKPTPNADAVPAAFTST